MKVQTYQGSYEQGLFIPFDGEIIPISGTAILTIIDEIPILDEQKPKTSRESVFGSMKGKVWMADDFDAPLEDFKEYME
jgi:hypothetical protein